MMKNLVNWLTFQLRNIMTSEKNSIMATFQLKKQKTFLVAKKDDIKAKIDSGELSKEKVLDFLALTKEKDW